MRFRRPSASMLVALVALVLAATGSAVAATQLQNGNKLIKKHSLSGNRLQNHTITGSQVNLKKLGTVPNAKKASSATTATTATTANNANALGGQPPTSYLTQGNRIGTNGIIRATGTGAGTNVVLFSVPPFSVSMTCTTAAAGTTLTVFASSSEANSILDGELVATANTPTDLGTDFDISPATTAFDEKDDVNMDLEAPSGAQAILIGADGVNSLGSDCWANWSGIH
jgi:hypothetical protein